MSRSRYRTPRKSGRRAALALFVALVFAVANPALAAWSGGGTGAAAGAATTMPGGNSPSVVVSGSSVTVRWPASTFTSGVNVEGYIVQRLDAASGQDANIAAACAGIVTATTCTESNVPAGSWVYTVTPVQGGWAGASSPPSPVVSVS
jgi:hypothetical protein